MRTPSPLRFEKLSPLRNSSVELSSREWTAFSAIRWWRAVRMPSAVRLETEHVRFAGELVPQRPRQLDEALGRKIDIAIFLYERSAELFVDEDVQRLIGVLLPRGYGIHVRFGQCLRKIRRDPAPGPCPDQVRRRYLGPDGGRDVRLRGSRSLGDSLGTPLLSVSSSTPAASIGNPPSSNHGL